MHQTPLPQTIEQTMFLLLIAAVVALLGRRVRVPYTVGLVAAGVVLALLHIGPELDLTKDLIFTAFLPPLIFEAAFHLEWKELRRDMLPLLTLATLSVVLGGAIIAVVMHFAAGWDWPVALLFGSLIAATDPVSVIATFKEAGLQGRLRLLVEAESLLNDGAAAVLFTVVLAAVLGGEVTAAGISVRFVLMVFGGLACGLAIGGAMLLLAGHTDDHLLECAFTTVGAYGSFLLAEHFHFSGVLATLACGILLGNVGSLGSFTDRGHEVVTAFWDYAAFVANSLIFLLIGVREAREMFAGVLGPLVVGIAVVTLSRAVVYPLSALFARAPQRIEVRHQHVLFWGGLRGALSLALALGLPPETPHRAEITAVTSGVVAFSIIVQGVTMVPFLRRLGLLGGESGDTTESTHP